MPGIYRILGKYELFPIEILTSWLYEFHTAKPPLSKFSGTWNCNGQIYSTALFHSIPHGENRTVTVGTNFVRFSIDWVYSKNALLISACPKKWCNQRKNVKGVQSIPWGTLKISFLNRSRLCFWKSCEVLWKFCAELESTFTLFSENSLDRMPVLRKCENWMKLLFKNVILSLPHGIDGMFNVFVW